VALQFAELNDRFVLVGVEDGGSPRRRRSSLRRQDGLDVNVAGLLRAGYRGGARPKHRGFD